VRYLRTFEPGQLKPGTFDYQTLLDWETGLIVAVRAPHGASGFERHVHRDADQLYFVLEGRMDLDLDGARHTLGPGTAAYIPAGTPHVNSYPHEGTELHLDVMAPPPPRGRTMLEPAVPASAGPGGAYVRGIDDAEASEVIPGFFAQDLVNRSLGSAHAAMRYARTQPTGPGTGWHIHDVDQVYFITGGTLEVDVAGTHLTARRNDLVVLPAGVPHRNWNPGPGQETHVVLFLPEPPAGQSWDYGVDFALDGMTLSPE
jgi:mannose-6-phosphate isomerase-like protein (cupin superfamily)